MLIRTQVSLAVQLVKKIAIKDETYNKLLDA
jgi:hypothetical protein